MTCGLTEAVYPLIQFVACRFQALAVSVVCSFHALAVSKPEARICKVSFTTKVEPHYTVYKEKLFC